MEDTIAVIPEEVHKRARIHVGLREAHHLRDPMAKLQFEIDVVSLKEAVFDSEAQLEQNQTKKNPSEITFMYVHYC